MKETIAGSPERHWIAARPVRVGLSVLLGGALLFLASRNLDLDTIRSSLIRADWGWVILAVLSVLINTLAKAMRWKVLLGPGGRDITFGRLLSALIIGQMLNLVFPARLGDLSRSYTIGGRGPGRVFTLGTVVLEKILDMFSYSILAISVVLMVPLPVFVRGPVYVLVLVTFAVAGAGTLVSRGRWAVAPLNRRFVTTLPERIHARIEGWWQSAVSSLGILQRRHDRLWLGFWTALIWATAVMNNHLMLRALGIQAPLAASLLLLVVLQAGISVASVPASIGIFEYLCVLVLALFQVDQVTALSYGVLLHAVVMLPMALAGLPLFWHFSADARRAAPA